MLIARPGAPTQQVSVVLVSIQCVTEVVFQHWTQQRLIRGKELLVRNCSKVLLYGGINGVTGLLRN